MAPKHMSSSASLRHHRHPTLAAQSPCVARSWHGGGPARPDPTLPLPAPAAAAAAETAAAQTRRTSTAAAADLVLLAIFGCSCQGSEGSPECGEPETAKTRRLRVAEW